MGLSIYWELSAGGTVDAVMVVTALHEAAPAAGFEEVGAIVCASATARVEGEPAIAERAWALAQGLTTVSLPGELPKRVAPAEVMVFRAANPGTEDAIFGLARYPRETGIGGYRLAGGCATQGASRRGGAPAFLKAHRAVVNLLDKARTLGLTVSVRDDGAFWETRDAKVLLDKHEEWEGLVASLGRKPAPKPCTLAADVRDQIEAIRGAQKRRDRRAVVEELEG